MVRQDLTSGFPVINLLSHYCGVDWREMPNAGGAFNVEGVAGLRFEAVPLSSKAPPYSPHRHDPIWATISAFRSSMKPPASARSTRQVWER